MKSRIRLCEMSLLAFLTSIAYENKVLIINKYILYFIVGVIE